MAVHTITNNIKTTLLSLIILLGWRLLPAQDVRVRAELDTNRALIGDQLTLILAVDKPVNTHVIFPQLSDTLTNKIEILHVSVIDTGHASGRMLLDQHLLVSVFDTGTFRIPPLTLIVLQESGPDTLETLPLDLQILALPTDSTIRDIKANAKAPLSLAETYPYGLILLGMGLLLWGLLYYVKRRKGRMILSPRKEPVEPPDVVALRELELLRSEKPWLHKHVKLYYVSLTDILRGYIEKRFHIMAMEQTTEEILASMKDETCRESDRLLLGHILQLADLVKFAKVIPDQAKNEEQVEVSINFVRNTAERIEADAPEKSSGTLSVSSNGEV